MATTEFVKLYEELGRLNEDTYRDSKAFWSGAAEKKLYDENFHRAFDAELQELGLMDIFAEDGSIASRSSYGRIKAAREANPDSWAVKALYKFWVLQFQDGVKTESEIQREQTEANRLEWLAWFKEKEAREKAERLEREAKEREREEQKRMELEAKNTKAQADYEALESYLPEFKTLVEKQVADLAESKRHLLIPIVEKIVKLRNEVDTSTRNMIYRYDERYETPKASILETLKTGKDLYELTFDLPPIDKRYPSAVIVVKLRNLFKMNSTGGIYNAKVTRSGAAVRANADIVFDVKVVDIEKTKLTNIINKWFDDIYEAIYLNLEKTLKKDQEEYDSVMSKVKAAKAAQAAADAGRPVDPKFISDILNELGKGVEDAEVQYDIYRGTHDGSSGAAYARVEAETVESVALSLVNCNWRIHTDSKDVISWRMTDSVDDLYDAIDEAFKAYKSGGLRLEITK